MASKKEIGEIGRRILKLLQDNPAGLDIHEIRAGLPDIDIQQHLDKRLRELRSRYRIRWKSQGKKSGTKYGKYIYEGEKSTATDGSAVPRKIRAAVLQMANGRCQMCGQTVTGDGVKLEADHKVPRTWGGTNELDNLWALCQQCNGGKRDFFKSMHDDEMKDIVSRESVWDRIATTLKLHEGKPVDSWFLEFVANFNDFQEDWQKRLRELRYPGIGLKISIAQKKLPSGKRSTSYQLDEWHELPADHAKIIKDHERKTKATIKAAED